MGLLKLRYDAGRREFLRAHVHLVDGAGYFFFPALSAPCGTKAVLQVGFGSSDERVLLRGTVWSKAAPGGVWLELPRAAGCLQRLSTGVARKTPRAASEQLVLVEPIGRAGLLCRLADVSEGGARLAACGNDFGCEGQELRIALPEAGPQGGQLEAYGRVAWARDGDVGVVWDRRDLASRAAVRRLLQIAEDEWDTAQTAVHPASCRCTKTPRRVVLLG